MLVWDVYIPIGKYEHTGENMSKPKLLNMILLNKRIKRNNIDFYISYSIIVEIISGENKTGIYKQNSSVEYDFSVNERYT